MTTMYDVSFSELIEKAAEELKKIPEMTPPEWSGFVKTGSHKQRPPTRDDWWYVRAASLLKTIYRYGPIGVSKLRRLYGGKKNRGYKPEKTVKGSGSIARKILQQLESIEFVKKVEKDSHKGRVITPKGKSFLDKIAAQILKTKPRIGSTLIKESKSVDVTKVAKKDDRKAEKKEAAPEAEKKEKKGEAKEGQAKKEEDAPEEKN